MWLPRCEGMNYLERFQADIVSVVESSDFTHYVMTSCRFERPLRFRTMPLNGQTPKPRPDDTESRKVVARRPELCQSFFQANFEARPA